MLSGVKSTYQYSVKEQSREIDHDTNSHGVPGIYFKYDMSALKVLVRQDREPVAQFLVRLCAGVGGLVRKLKIKFFLLKIPQISLHLLSYVAETFQVLQ
jgi:hypothetical protein